MKVIAGGGLSDLVEQGVDVSKHDHLHGGAPRQLLSEKCGVHPEPCTWNLDVDAGWRPLVPQHEGHTNNTFVADGSDFGSVAVSHGVYKRTNPGLDEVTKLYHFVGFIERLFVFERHRFKMGTKSFVISRWEQGEQSVSGSHGPLGALGHFCSSDLLELDRRHSEGRSRNSVLRGPSQF